MITRLTSPAFSICAEVHVPAPLNVYRHRADLIQEFGRRNATFWVSWKVLARGTGWNGQKRAVRERNRRKHPPAAPVFRKRFTYRTKRQRVTGATISPVLREHVVDLGFIAENNDGFQLRLYFVLNNFQGYVFAMTPSATKFK